MPFLCCCGTRSPRFQSRLSAYTVHDLPSRDFPEPTPEQSRPEKCPGKSRSPLVCAAERAFSVVHERAVTCGRLIHRAAPALRVKLMCFGCKNQPMGAAPRWHRSGCPVARTPALRVQSVLGTPWSMAHEQKQCGTSASLPMSAVLMEAY